MVISARPDVVTISLAALRIARSVRPLRGRPLFFWIGIVAAVIALQYTKRDVPSVMIPEEGEKVMKNIRLGRSALEVSRIAFGTWQLGGDWGATDEEAAMAAIQRAADRGINFFDTAQAYGFGASETLLAKALKGRPRDQFVIA